MGYDNKDTTKLPWYHKNRLQLYTFDELEPYLRDNELLLTGYRQRYSYKEAFISLFHWHNESINIWSHIFGFVCFIVFTIDSWMKLDNMDKLVICGMLISACYTFICSSLFHLNICVSKKASEFFGCLDYSGISALICGGCSASIYYLLYCDKKALVISMGLLFTSNCVGIVGPTFSFWKSPQFRTGRAIVYLSSGFVTILPIAYYIFTYGFSELPDIRANSAIPATLCMIFQYTFGAYIYAKRWPESSYPKTFDLIGASHQIWHLFVFTATLTLYYSVYQLMEWRASGNHFCPASS